jgi:putative ABC transport system permease protein
MEYIGQVWKKYIPEKPFDYQFLDERLDSMYRAEQRVGDIATKFAGVAIVIACLGLFGLAAFTAEQRTKEIGIRKTLGASTSNIIGLLSREFAILVLVADVIAFPVIYWVMSGWLEDFIYRIELGVLVFVFSGLLTMAIAMITVSSQAIRAAFTDPVTALRHE